MSSNLTGLGVKKQRRGFPIIALLSFAMILIALALFVTELVAFSQQEERLPADVSVANIAVGGLTRDEAIAKWELAYAEPITLYYENQYGQHPIILNPDSINFRLSSASMMADALSSGETDGGFWVRFMNYLMRRDDDESRNIAIQADYQANKLQEFIDDVSLRYNQEGGEIGYDTQTLTLFQGGEGYKLDTERALTMIEEALLRPTNRVVYLPVLGASSGKLYTLNNLKELLIAYLDEQGFIYDGISTVASIFIVDLTTGEELNINGDVAFSAASTMKVPIMIDYYRTLSFEPTPEEAWLMANSLLCSNNSSSNLIMQIIGQDDLFRGIQSVTDTTQFLGARNTFITAPFFLGVEGQELGSNPIPETEPNPRFDTGADPFNQTTAEDMGVLMNLIYDCAQHNSGLVSAYPAGEFNQKECAQMLEIMSVNNLERLLQGGLPEDTRISHKNGWIFDTVGDAGVVFPLNGQDYIISVFLWEQTDFQDYEKLWPLVEEISRAAWNYFVPESQIITGRDNLPPTAQACEGNYLPPSPEAVNLNDMDSWKSLPGS